jgi:hypothetical protein
MMLPPPAPIMCGNTARLTRYGPGEVDGQNLRPFVGFDVDDCPCAVMRCRRVDQHARRADLADEPSDDGLDRLGVRDVAGVRDRRSAASVRDRCRRLVRGSAVDIDTADVGPERRERLCDGAANTGPRSNHKRGPAVEAKDILVHARHSPDLC